MSIIRLSYIPRFESIKFLLKNLWKMLDKRISFVYNNQVCECQVILRTEYLKKGDRLCQPLTS